MREKKTQKRTKIKIREKIKTRDKGKTKGDLKKPRFKIKSLDGKSK
jgi:hypothetical protein